MDGNAEKYLMALYAETNNKRPRLANVGLELGLEQEELGRAANSLYTAGLVGGVVVRFGDDDASPVLATVENIVLTRRGAHYVEKALGLKSTASSIQRLQKIIAIASKPGWERVKGIAENALQEHMQG
ncbi:MAG TPA: hypothetical protein PKA10_18230 [Selenomonadales bacterium]|nr:hypothetical protein [Selenomonadales bacterium]